MSWRGSTLGLPHSVRAVPFSRTYFPTRRGPLRTTNLSSRSSLAVTCRRLDRYPKSKGLRDKSEPSYNAHERGSCPVTAACHHGLFSRSRELTSSSRMLPQWCYPPVLMRQTTLHLMITEILSHSKQGPMNIALCNYPQC